MSWDVVIGLEIHVQLATKSKIFSASPTRYGAQPNTQADAVDLGLPGVLPVLNQEAVRLAAIFGLAIDATVAQRSVFARKNYFYPDLPKGYQISQFELPIVVGGHIDIPLAGGGSKRVALTRAHLEEDAGKSLHEDFHGLTGIDLNRAGTPLLEIVSEPELRSAAEAVTYMRKIHSLVRYLGISDGNMQEGSFRADANVSLRPLGESALGTRTEIKNINSFRFVELAINSEIERQAALLEAGGSVVQETRLYDSDRNETRPMRSKEQANDYRYFPDPDLLPVEIDVRLLDSLRAALPELPDAKQRRYTAELGLSGDVAEQLTVSRESAEYFEAVCAQIASADAAKLAANWVIGELAAALNRAELSIDASPISAIQLGGLLRRVKDGTLSGNLARQVFETLWSSPDSDPDAADRIISEQGLAQVSDTDAIGKAIAQIVAANPGQVAQYRAGKTKVKGFFVGQVMKAFQGKANPQQVNALLQRLLDDE